MNYERAAKLLLMLSSDQDGEVLNAARALTKMGIHELAELVRRGGLSAPAPTTIASEAVWPADWNLRDFMTPKPSRSKRPKVDHYADMVEDVVELFKAKRPDIDDAGFDRKSIRRFLRKLDIDAVIEAVDIACSRVNAENAFRYFCGICWARIRELEEAA